MRLRPDGSVQSASTPTETNVGRGSDHALYRCVITKVIYVGDPANITTNSSNPRVMYDAVVLGGYASGQIVSNCRLASDLGGNSAYYERVLRACTKDISNSRLSDADGDVVFVQFVQGHTAYPVIVALDNGINTVGKIGASLSDGPRSIREYNGVRETINKDGEFIQEVKGGSANPEKGGFEPASAALVTTTISKDEKITRTFKSGLTIVEDGAGDKVSRTLKGGISIVEDGKADKVTVTTAGGAIVDIDGKGGKITLTKGATIIELDGNGDKISLKGGFVDLGSSVSDFAVLFTELLTAFNTHTHIYVAPAIPAGPAPTTPPVAPMLQTVGSLTVKVQP